MDTSNLKPFYTYLESRTDDRIKSLLAQMDTSYKGVLLDKEKRLVRITKTISYSTQDRVENIQQEQEITFDNYFIPSPHEFDIVDNMEGLVIFLKDKTPSTNTNIQMDYKCIFMPTGILTEAKLQGNNNTFGLRTEIYKSINDLSLVIDKINTIITKLVIPVVQATPVVDPVTGTQLTTELNNIKANLQDSIQNLEP